MKKFRAGIIGCGNIFPMHAEALRKLEVVDLVAVCDIKKDRAIGAADKYDVTSYTDYHEMISKENLDVVHICLPHYLHEKVTVEAAKQGIHVLSEKPMSISVASAERMIQSSETAGIKLGIIFQNRYNTGAKLLKKMIDNGEIGQILSGKCQVTWNRDNLYYSNSDWKGTWEKEGGGVIIDQAIHTLDLINWLMDQEPIKVDATIRNRTHNLIEVEDFAEGIIYYSEGAIISFLANNYYSYDAPVEIEFHTDQAIIKIIGAKLMIDYFDNRPSIIEDISEEDYIKNGDATKTYWGTGHIIQIEEFYKYLNESSSFLVTGYEALRTQKLVEAIYQSAKMNKEAFF